MKKGGKVQSSICNKFWIFNKILVFYISVVFYYYDDDLCGIFADGRSCPEMLLSFYDGFIFLSSSVRKPYYSAICFQVMSDRL